MMLCSWRSGTAGLLFLAAAAEAFVTPAMTPAQNHRSLSLRHGLSPLHMALSGGEPVIVYGGFERIGDPSVCPSRALARRRACTSLRIYEAFPDRIPWHVLIPRPAAVTILRTLADAGFRPVCRVPAGFSENSPTKWSLDGMPKTLPQGTLLVTDKMPAVAGAVLCPEEPVTGPECVGALQGLEGLSKVVLISRVGVDRRENFMIKMNPFLKIDKWHDSEEAVKAFCVENGLDLTIVRTGALAGGAFFETQPEFQTALEDSLFDMENQAMKMSAVDSIDGKTTRDLAATAVTQALKRDVPVFSVVSAKSAPLKCGVCNHMKLPAARGNRERKCFTPSAAEWDAAFAQI